MIGKTWIQSSTINKVPPMLRFITKDASGKILLPVLIGTGVLLVVISMTMAKTSSTSFCMSCHEMNVYKEELEKSSHAMTKDKKPMDCKDCHIPNTVSGRYVVIKTLFGVRDTFVHYFGDPDNLNRKEMQAFTRRFIPDENCRSCHPDLMKDTEDKELSEIGRLSHEAYLGKNGQTRRGCAGCHFNMAHLPEFDRWYTFNEEFAKNLPLKKESK